MINMIFYMMIHLYNMIYIYVYMYICACMYIQVYTITSKQMTELPSQIQNPTKRRCTPQSNHGFAAENRHMFFGNK